MNFQVTVEPSHHQFLVKPDQTLLEAALEAGIVLPYSCRNGVCSSCKGKIITGQFEAGAQPSQILSSEELANGYTLFCQIHPRSDMVIEVEEVRLASDIQIRKLPARVIKMKAATPDIMVLTLQLPSAEKFCYYAGQYVEFMLKDGRRRSYSMASAPRADNVLEFHIRHMPGGVFTDQVFKSHDKPLKERDILRLEGPFGSFFLREESDKPIIFLASGTGFAPIKAIMEYMVHQNISRDVHFYWGGRRPQDLYRHCLALEWAALFPNFRYIPVVCEALPEDKWQGREGWVHHAVMQDHPNLAQYQVYACGAPAMVEAARCELVMQCALPDNEFYADAFTSAADTKNNGND